MSISNIEKHYVWLRSQYSDNSDLLLHNSVDCVGEPITMSWLRKLEAGDVEPTKTAFANASVEGSSRIEAGRQRQIEVVKRFGLGWEELIHA